MNVEELLAQARTHIRLGQMDQAQSILKTILDQDPSNPEAWILSAQASESQGEMLFCLRKACSFKPGILDHHPDASRLRALFYVNKILSNPESENSVRIALSRKRVETDNRRTTRSDIFLRSIKYIAGRLLTIAVTIFLGVFLTVVLANKGGQIDNSVEDEVELELMRSLPAEVCYSCYPTSPEDQVIIDQVYSSLVKQAGLRLPFIPRHVLWTLRALNLDLGHRISMKGTPFFLAKGSDAPKVILGELPHSLLLVGSAFLLVILLGIPLALFLFRTNGSRLERLFSVLSPISSIPSWVLGAMLVLVFAAQLRWLPPSGMYDPIPPENTWQTLLTVTRHLVLPVLAIFLSLFFQLVYSWKTLFLLHATEEHVDLARAMGLSSRRIEQEHILRPTLPFMVTNLSLIMVSFWQMTIALEYLFNWPGIGRLYINSLPNLFGETIFPGIMPIVVGIVVIFAYILGITVFILDILYGVLDPRVRVGAEEQTIKLETSGKQVAPGKKPYRRKLTASYTPAVKSPFGTTLHPMKTAAGASRKRARSGTRGIFTFLSELRRYPSAIVGLVIILFLIAGSVAAVVIYPYDQLGKLWYTSLLTGKSYIPKLAQPVWVNWLRHDPLPSSIIMDSRNGSAEKTTQLYDAAGTGSFGIDFFVDFPYEEYPQSFVLYFDVHYDIKRPFVIATWNTPDGRQLRYGDFSPENGNPYRLSDVGSPRRIAAANPDWQNWFVDSGYQATPDYYLLFSDPSLDYPAVLPGEYNLHLEVMTFEPGTSLDAELVILGQVAGWAGTDYLRRDLLLPLLWGMPLALALGLVGASLTTFLSMLLAAMAVWYGGWLDGLLQRLIEGIMILPVIAIGVIFYAYYNMNIWLFLSIIALLNVFGSPAKSFRAAFLQVKESPYIEAAKASGAGNMRIILHYMVPAIVPLFVPQLIALIPSYVFLEATLGLFGVNSLYPTWGNVIYDALRHGSAYGSGYWVLEPIFLLLLTGLAFAMLGFALERILNPRLRESF